MLTIDIFIRIMSIIIGSSIFFVWVIRYDNIVKEFQDYNFSSNLRDAIGIIKCSAAVMLFIGEPILIFFASLILLILMLAAFIIHIKYRHSIIKTIPSFSLSCANIFIIYYSVPYISQYI